MTGAGLMISTRTAELFDSMVSWAVASESAVTRNVKVPVAGSVASRSIARFVSAGTTVSPCATMELPARNTQCEIGAGMRPPLLSVNE